jgi:tetratricopeptide (TPR) repeat protein
VKLDTGTMFQRRSYAVKNTQSTKEPLPERKIFTVSYTASSLDSLVVPLGDILAKAEKANDWEPNEPSILTTFGAAQYRLDSYEDALKTLTKSAKILSDAGEEPNPVNVAFTVMTLHRMGHVNEAKSKLEQLKELCKDEQFAEDMDVQALLAEAEKLVTGEKQ